LNWQAIQLGGVGNTVIRSCLNVQPGEDVAIVADHDSDFAIVEALTAATINAGAVPTVLVMPKRERAGAPATKIVAEALSGADVIVAPTSTALGFTPEFGIALKEHGARAILMTGATRAQLLGGAALANYDEVYKITRPLADALTEGETIHVTSEAGSDLTASLVGVKAGCGAARAHEPGQVSAFPSGEAWMAPATGTANGVLVADGSGHMLGRLEEPIRVTFENGRAVNIEGGHQAEQLRRLIDGVENGDNIGELSIGTNPAARSNGDITEDKKQLGTVHFALGNSVVGGEVKSPVHIDLLVEYPRVEIDGAVVVDDRKVLV
jgi:leucyl aminopeptidase (aminopeptidase T)